MAKYIDPRTTKEMKKMPLVLEEDMENALDFNDTFSPINVEPPEHLDDCAKEYYRTFVAEIQKLGTSNILDEALLENLCETLSDIRHYREVLRKNGDHFIQGPHNIKEHPAVKLIDTATKNSIRLMNELNLSAATRKFLKEQNDSGNSALAKYQ